ncbi:MAG: hypothetical protein RLZZ04_4212 [Cyanobacteriota bacterium]
MVWNYHRLSNYEFASSPRQKYVAQLENFYSTLKELSDRLFPARINAGNIYYSNLNLNSRNSKK